MRRILFLISFLFCGHLVFGQVHWLINADSNPKCDFLYKGKFINKETDEKSTDGYFIVFKDGYAIDYINNGEFYVKSKIEFLSDCKYKSTVTEVTIPNYNLGPGAVIYTEIIETAVIDKLVKIRSTLNGNSNVFVLQKVE